LKATLTSFDPKSTQGAVLFVSGRASKKIGSSVGTEDAGASRKIKETQPTEIVMARINDTFITCALLSLIRN
jgi:hypothetical protein